MTYVIDHGSKVFDLFGLLITFITDILQDTSFVLLASELDAKSLWESLRGALKFKRGMRNKNSSL